MSIYDESLVCVGGHWLKDTDENARIYTINPPGGYGLSEALICSVCLQKPEMAHIKDRLHENAGFTYEEMGAK